MLGSSTLRRSVAIGLTAFLFSVLPVINAHAQGQIKALPTKPKPGLVKPAYAIPYVDNNAGFYAMGAMAFDDLYAYVATPGGLFRAQTPLGPGSQFELTGFQGRPVVNVYVHQNVLYVLKYGRETLGGPATDHTFLKSIDHGATFIPIDNGLQECIEPFCYYLTPTEAMFKDNLIYLNAGGGPNLMFSNNGGASWTPLLGSLQQMSCAYQPFELVGTRMLVGGQCLETAYLRGGILRTDLMGWVQLPTSAGTPPLGGRFVEFIENKPNTTDVYAGVAGGLLKSTDSGQTFKYILLYSSGAPVPVIDEIFFPSNLPNVIVVGGRDNGRTGPYLAYSKDNGETWHDISPQALLYAGLPGKGTYNDEVEFIGQAPDGRIYAGLRRIDTNTMLILQLRVDVAMLRQ